VKDCYWSNELNDAEIICFETMNAYSMKHQVTKIFMTCHMITVNFVAIYCHKEEAKVVPVLN
jgi:hypothetical protein